MECFFCKGKLEEKLTTFTADIGNCVIVIRNVPSQVCTQCGEVSYSTEIMQQIEEIVNSLKAEYQKPVWRPEISVLNYAERKAA
jgi:YgiT-type zinc finger domain-containing protein